MKRPWPVAGILAAVVLSPATWNPDGISEQESTGAAPSSLAAEQVEVTGTPYAGIVSDDGAPAIRLSSKDTATWTAQLPPGSEYLTFTAKHDVPGPVDLLVRAEHAGERVDYPLRLDKNNNRYYEQSLQLPEKFQQSGGGEVTVSIRPLQKDSDLLMRNRLTFIPKAPGKAPAGEPIFCAQDVRECPDGSYVNRQPPTCEFTACPGDPGRPSESEPAGKSGLLQRLIDLIRTAFSRLR